MMRAALSTALLIMTAATTQAADWGTYRDTVYDCRLDYPRDRFKQDPFDVTQPFQRFSGGDSGTFFRVMGVENKDKLSVGAIRTKYMAADIPGDIVYERAKNDFLVLSGFRGESIFYSRVAVSADNGIICILEITYPRTEKRAFDGIVTRMSRSFDVTR